MADGIGDEQLQVFCGKLAEFRDSLLADEKLLLDGILKVAWRATAPEASVNNEFDGCFEPAQAALILAYDHDYTIALAQGLTVIRPNVIKP